MLERWELASPNLLDNALDGSFCSYISKGERDPLGSPSIIDELVGRILVTDNSQDVALGA